MTSCTINTSVRNMLQIFFAPIWPAVFLCLSHAGLDIWLRELLEATGGDYILTFRCHKLSGFSDNGVTFR